MTEALAEYSRDSDANISAERVYYKEYYPEIAANPNWRREVDRFYVVNPFSINGTMVGPRPGYPHNQPHYPGYVELNARVEQLKKQRQNKHERGAVEVASRTGMDALFPTRTTISVDGIVDGQIKEFLADEPKKLKLRQPAETELVEILKNTPYDDFILDRIRIRKLIEELAQRADARKETQRAGKSKRRKTMSRKKKNRW